MAEGEDPNQPGIPFRPRGRRNRLRRPVSTPGQGTMLRAHALFQRVAAGAGFPAWRPAAFHLPT
jgi:hypothetical protein